jgi:ABC-2 type transport system ATP-binding protein
MIEVDSLTKRYGRATAVDGVSFRVERGEVLGFLGPNGAGKTTTMRILTCYLPPTDGTARVAGYDVFAQPLEVKKRVGYLPETPPLYPDMGVRDYLDFCARIKGVPVGERRQRVDDAVEKCRVGEVRQTLIGKLSKGYRQRVGLAQAILHNPDVLILDEPTAGLDPKQIIETRDLIRSFAGSHTVVLSTHILPEVSMTCGRVLIINKGRVVAEDTPENLTRRLKGAGVLRLEAQGEEAALVAAAKAVPGVLAVHGRGRHDGAVVLDVEPASGRDVRADLARALVGQGFGLLGLQQLGMSLEEIFLQLTTTDNAEAAPAAQAS